MGLTEPVDGSADVSTGLSEHDVTDIGDRVDFGVSVLEFTHLVGSVWRIAAKRSKISSIARA